jgi:hypothetical protein
MGHVIQLNTVTKINKINSSPYTTILLDILHLYTLYIMLLYIMCFC